MRGSLRVGDSAAMANWCAGLENRSPRNQGQGKHVESTKNYDGNVRRSTYLSTARKGNVF